MLSVSSLSKCLFVGLVALAVIAFTAGPARADLVNATDVNPDPNIFECHLTADEFVYTIDGDDVSCLIYRDDPPFPFVPAAPNIPAPQIQVKIGDLVIVHLVSLLEPANGNTSIHWHGIELDNNSDGTGVTQDRLEKFDTHVYRFRCPRAGVFWYHPHMKPPHQNHSGMYGALIVRDATATTDREGDLEAAGTIPTNVRTLVLSDINYETGAVDPVPPHTPGFDVGGVLKTVHEMIMDCAAALAGGVMDMMNCRIDRGNTVLVNGVKPDSGAETPKIFARSGEGIRLRLINPSNTRYFRLAGRDAANMHQDLFRIGGEGGFLDFVRREGGMPGGYDTEYEVGEILLAAADRADIVIVPTGNDGDIIKIIGRDAARGAASVGGGDYDIFFIEILGVEMPAFTIAEGDDVLGAGGVESIKGLATTPLSPVPLGELGVTDLEIQLTNVLDAAELPAVSGPSIDGRIGHLEDSGPDFMAVPSQPTSRYCNIDDVLELTVFNTTGASHPFHLHGFSMQPVRILDAADMTIYTYPYNEFVDVVDIKTMQKLVFRVRIEDRGIICDDVVIPYACADSNCGGAVGRWVHHCHIFHHAALGMISELVVLPDPDAVPPVVTCAMARSICWPPSGGLLPVGLTFTTMDVCDPMPTNTLSVYSTEPDGAAPFSPDWMLTPPSFLRLRSQRAYPGPGRVYIAVVNSVDAGGNRGVDCCTTIVPAIPTGMNILMLRMTAMAAEAACDASAVDVAPPGFMPLVVGTPLP